MADDTASVPADKPKPIPRRLRFEVFRRDGHTCRHCGGKAPDVHLTVDHVIPRALGGSDDPSNLVTACKDCNAGKSSTSPSEHLVAEVDARALQWADALEAVAQKRRQEWAEADSQIERFDEAWNRWWYGADKTPIPRAAGWEASIARFIEAGLDIVDLTRFVNVAGNSQAPAASTWRYFCGVCWNEINRRQELALDVVSGGTTATEDDEEDSPEYNRGYDNGWNDAADFYRPDKT